MSTSLQTCILYLVSCFLLYLILPLSNIITRIKLKRNVLVGGPRLFTQRIAHVAHIPKPVGSSSNSNALAIGSMTRTAAEEVSADGEHVMSLVSARDARPSCTTKVSTMMLLTSAVPLFSWSSRRQLQASCRIMTAAARARRHCRHTGDSCQCGRAR